MGASRNSCKRWQSLPPNFPLSFPSLFILLPLPALPPCPVHSAPADPLNAVRDLGERCKLPWWGLGQIPGRIRNLGVFKAGETSLVSTIL